MKPTEADLEKLLCQAPRPQPPAGLEGQILAAAPNSRPPSSVSVTGGWFWRWLNSWRLALATTCLAILAWGVAARQQAELRLLREEVQALRQQAENAAAATLPAPGAARESSATGVAVKSDRADLERLRGEVVKLQEEQAAAAKLSAENQQMRSELANRAQAALPEDFTALREARDRAQRISCVNNMKQLGLAVRVWATDNNDTFPKHVLDMTNELVTPKVLVCPADTNRQPAASWSVFTPANFSYEYLAPDGTPDDPTRVLFRCSVHRGSVGLTDGSVQQLSEKRQAESLVTRDGKLYLDNTAGTNPTGGSRR